MFAKQKGKPMVWIPKEVLQPKIDRAVAAKAAIEAGAARERAVNAK